MVGAGATLWPLIDKSSLFSRPKRRKLPDWIIRRPEELDKVVTALTKRAAGDTGITTALHGVGGYGKTTLATMVCDNARVRRHFGDRIYRVTIGSDVISPVSIASKVNGVINLISGENVTETDPELAGERLSALLASGPRKLLVIDDVWRVDQLDPFLGGGHRCARLFTTRVPSLVTSEMVPVQVDQMSPEQSTDLLTHNLPPIERPAISGLLAATGGWPLLASLVNKILIAASDSGEDLAQAAMELTEKLNIAGPTVPDDLLRVDLGQSASRNRTVRATIEASTELLTKEDTERFVELGLFAEDESIPFRLAHLLWQATAGRHETGSIASL